MVERDLAKVEVAGSSPVSRSITPSSKHDFVHVRVTTGTPTTFHSGSPLVLRINDGDSDHLSISESGGARLR